MEIQEKVRQMMQHIDLSDDGKKFCVWNELVESYFPEDPDLPVIMEKLNNLMNLMTQELNNGNWKSFGERDFEDDIWFLI